MPAAEHPIASEIDRLRQLYLAGALDEALALAQALSLRAPDIPEILNIRGMLAYRRGAFAEAAALLRAAAAASPNDGAVWANLGAALRAQGDLAGAEAVYDQALQVAPDVQALHGNLANVLIDQHKAAAAEARVLEALKLGPRTANLMTTLGLALSHQGRLVEAEKAFREALELNPADYDACRNLGSILAGLAQFDEAEGLQRRALALRPDYAAGHSSLLFGMNYRPDLTAEQIAGHYRRFEAQHARGAPPPSPYANLPEPVRRLRVGYVSPDFTDHVVAMFMLPILAAHDKSRFEITCYAEVRHQDGTSAKVQALADRWVSTVGLSDQALAERIRADGIDILVDLAGHTTGNRLLAFAHRPAPVQLTYFIGHGMTTGLSAIDAFIGDSRLAPPGCEALFGERRVIRLGRAPLAYVAPPAMPEPQPPPALSKGFVTFGYFGRSIRLNEGVIRAWSVMLNRLPGSRLMLNNAPFGDPQTAALFAQRFARYGVPAGRLDLVNTRPQSRTWAAYGEIDIALDPFPHNAGTTTIEALWMGVPVLTLADRPSVGRLGAMILGALGLDDWITASPEDYVAKGLAAAGDLNALAKLRGELRPRFAASPLADPAGLTRSLEEAYRQLWRDWCEAAPASHA
ncbi:O-linked N-acetylglucosamine transferase, SPINDLY family protein [Phenylobacterium montanum]|uniref:protein O-GlcNAc transferase n=1 Tax=Phenylobacterium montanum TaxID=2823693 RepID=A0A975FWE9_9CAUL|nr:tetratricopeptide repeat protein [Caulobacter sp. S6]QUD86509.1 tetratricopeptide repeat protein [Caulobacter sp. S6]